MPSSQFAEEQKVDKELAQASPPPKSTASLSLGDAQELVAALTAISLKFGNNEKGVIATMNELLTRSDVLNHEQRDIIVPLLGDLKTLLKTSQEELQNFNTNAQKSLETQIKEVISKVDLSPLHARVDKANAVLVNSAAEFETKAEEIKKIAAQTKTLGFWSSFKFMLTGVATAAGILYGFFSYREAQIEAKLKAKYDEQLHTKLEKFQPFTRLNQEHYGISVVQRNNLDHIQLFFRDTSGTIQSGRSFATAEDGKKFQVTFIEIPIYK